MTPADDQLRTARMRAQLLTGRPADGVSSAVARMVAIQAQSPGPARLAVRARTSGRTTEDVDRACADRTLVCTWAVRGTLHLVLAEDVRWLVDLLGPVFARRNRRRRQALGLDEDTCDRALGVIERILRGSPPLTRAELITRLAEEGVNVDATTQAPAHLVMYAAMSGLLCRGPDAGGNEPTYVLLDEWVPGGRRLHGEEALAELARRYLAGHGPAGVADLLAWSGLPAANGRTAFELIAGETEEAGPELSVLSSADPGTGEDRPRLLGHFDPLLLGYRGRGLILDPTYQKRIQAGGGFIQPTIVIDGRVAGTWRLNRRTAEVALEPFTGLPLDAREALRAEARDIGRFLGRP